VEMNSRRVTELESVHNNARLLSDMLDQYQLGQTSAEELELIKELHQSCERLRPSVFRLASETQDNESVLSEYRFGKYEHMLLQLLNGNMFTQCISTLLRRLLCL
jgi:ADP-ribosylation factor-binding protein GGA